MSVTHAARVRNKTTARASDATGQQRRPRYRSFLGLAAHGRHLAPTRLAVHPDSPCLAGVKAGVQAGVQAGVGWGQDPDCGACPG